MSELPVNKRLSLVGWVLAFSPALSLLCIISMAVHARLSLGHWPMSESYDTPALHAHGFVLAFLLFFTLLASIPLWFLRLFFLSERIPIMTLQNQVGMYEVGWLLILLYVSIDPGRFVAWLAD